MCKRSTWMVLDEYFLPESTSSIVHLLPPQALIDSGYGSPTSAPSMTLPQQFDDISSHLDVIENLLPTMTIPQQFDYISSHLDVVENLLPPEVKEDNPNKKNYNDFYEDVLPGYNNNVGQFVI